MPPLLAPTTPWEQRNAALDGTPRKKTNIGGSPVAVVSDSTVTSTIPTVGAQLQQVQPYSLRTSPTRLMHAPLVVGRAGPGPELEEATVSNATTTGTTVKHSHKRNDGESSWFWWWVLTVLYCLLLAYAMSQPEREAVATNGSRTDSAPTAFVQEEDDTLLIVKDEPVNEQALQQVLEGSTDPLYHVVLSMPADQPALTKADIVVVASDSDVDSLVIPSVIVGWC